MTESGQASEHVKRMLVAVLFFAHQTVVDVEVIRADTEKTAMKKKRSLDLKC